jgi:hypothetical protein
VNTDRILGLQSEYARLHNEVLSRAGRGTLDQAATEQLQRREFEIVTELRSLGATPYAPRGDLFRATRRSERKASQ